MNRNSHDTRCKRTFRLTALTIPALLLIAASGAAHQDSSADQTRSTASSRSNDDAASLEEQLRELQANIARLETALKQGHQSKESSSTQNTSADSMKMKPPKSDMKKGGMDNGGTNKDGMKKGMGKNTGMGGKEKMSGGMNTLGKTLNQNQGPGMRMMGQLKSMGQTQIASSLPGFPGASHLYHIGATSFFLDHPEHITLTTDQQTSLNGMKEKTLLEQATFDRQIAETEQELWVLTSADSPDAGKVETKVREIERLGGDKRIAFIRAIGNAAKELTQEQRMALVGTLSPDHGAAAGGE